MKLGISLMLTVAILQSVMIVFAKLASFYISPILIGVFYYLIPLIFVLVTTGNKKELLSYEKGELTTLLLRGAFSASSVIIYLYTVTILDFGVANVLFNLTPIFVALLASLLLSEKTGWFCYIGLITALIGVYLMVTPTNSKEFFNYLALFALLSSVLMSVAIILMKSLIVKGMSGKKIILNLYLYATIFSILLLVLGKAVFNIEILKTHLAWVHHIKPTAILLTFGLVSLFSQKLITKAYSYLSSNVATPILFVSVPVSSLLGYMIWGQQLDAAEATGMLLVICGVIVSVLKRRSGNEIQKT